ncbi:MULTISPECIES: SDR family NAD(P)-dependent oxidoreductase [unclassified Frankia]|uniref:SDR family NAD(P)-dependent oxidoreductase n=1 Tax=unclassified Frankia TaxID=2632575 RepID=UPI00200FA3B4|nr:MULTISPECIES: SDR family oxidoreductase [unclassified Frankia]MCK9896342.1 SDR family oxidoreductase [Frankia sp. AgB32]MCL9793241.1 SDR family oxidoreductase [Frankia sp. AgKG'84/4]
MSQLTDEVALVTGAGRGIGRAIALRFAEEGAAVVVTARSSDQIDETVALIKAAGGRAAAIPANVTDLDAVQAVLDFTRKEFGPVSLLVNNAGGGVRGSAGKFETMEPSAVVRGLNVNLVAAMLTTRLALPDMIAASHGRIINMASGAGMLAMPYVVPYGVAKTGVIRFSEMLALEMEGRGISVFSITPGNVLSKLTDPIWPQRETLAANPPEGFSWIFPPGHELEDKGWYPPERAAELCAFLASGRADAVSGRFFSVHYDEVEIAAQAERVVSDELYTLRLQTLAGPEPAIIYGDRAKK